MMTRFFILVATCVTSLSLYVMPVFAGASNKSHQQIAKADSIAANVTPQEEGKQKATRAQIKQLMAGYYLASRFAQSKHDWSNASNFIQPLFSSELSQEEITQRAMVIAMGAGQSNRAIELAHKMREITPSISNTIADTFLIVEAFKQKDYEKARKIFGGMSPDATSTFIGPFIEGWIGAAQNRINVKNLRQNTVQLYHGILISDFLDDHTDVEQMIEKAMKIEDITLQEMERIADLYAHVGLKDKALKLYDTVLENFPDNDAVKEKTKSLKNGTLEPLFEKIKTPQEGLALAFYDISRILFNEQNNESSRVFAYLAKYLSPTLSQPNFLLAEINVQYEQYDKAIALYSDVLKSDENYMSAQYEIVDIYDLTGQYDSALDILNDMAKKEKNPDTLIRLGDLYRHQSKYKKALNLYNRAIDEIDGTVPENYWHVYYVRGIAYEQLNDWDKAEKDLKTALKYQPDHPYVLNYLGYSWADKGINLDKATEMIQRAVDARPTDGYITDSLGWVMYRNSDYTNAVTTLERAVELLPYDPTINNHLGDAYWKVGRKLEARFQWERAKNHSKDETQIEAISEKLSLGLSNKHDKDTAHRIIAH